MMKTYAPTASLVKRGLTKAPSPKPTPPGLARRGRWSPPMPQG